MSLWTALVIIQGTMNTPVPLIAATPNEPLSLHVGPNAPDKPNIDLEVKASQGQHIGKMTGVEADTYVNAPTAITLTFPEQALCEAAKRTLLEQIGVTSVACFQSQ